MILAVETSTPVCSVALKTTDAEIYELRETGKGIHSEKLFLFIEELMKSHGIGVSQLSEILISAGPGSYTGLRIGAAAVKGLLFRRTIPLRVLGSLEAMAAGVVTRQPGARKIHCVIDARRNHLYHQFFDFANDEIGVGEVAARSIQNLDSIIKKNDIVVGTGAERLSSFEQKGINFFDSSYISASNLMYALEHSTFKHRFRGVDPGDFEPDYVSMGQPGG